jgi:hypothetical protein
MTPGKRYQGEPCKRGHSGERYVSSGKCVACRAATKARHRPQAAAYARKRRANLTARSISELNARRAPYFQAYNAANREARRAYEREYRAKHPERVNAKLARYRAANREVIRARDRARLNAQRAPIAAAPRVLANEEMLFFLAIYARMTAAGVEDLIGDDYQFVSHGELDVLPIPYDRKLTLMLAVADKHFFHDRPN